MLGEPIEAALGGPLTGPALDEIVRAVWRALGEGVIDWAEAERLDGLVHARRARMKAGGGSWGGGFAEGPQRACAALSGALAAAARRRPRDPDRVAALERRRRVASSGALPPHAAGWLAEGQRAVLSVVGREAARGVPSCTWPIAKIAALAGVERTTVQDALKLAARLGLVRVRHRPRVGAKSKTNVVTVEDKAWWRWLRRGPKRAAGDPPPSSGCSSGGGGSKRLDPMITEELRRRGRGAEGPAGAPGGGLEGPGTGETGRPSGWPGTGGPREGPAGGG